MLRSESGNATFYGAAVILVIFFLIWLVLGLSPFDVLSDFGLGFSGMAKDEKHRLEGGSSSSAPGWEELRPVTVAGLAPVANAAGGV